MYFTIEIWICQWLMEYGRGITVPNLIVSEHPGRYFFTLFQLRNRIELQGASPTVVESIVLGSWHLIFREEKVGEFKIGTIFIGRVISGVCQRFGWRSARRHVNTILVTRCS
jgi:hypothetical protein